MDKTRSTGGQASENPMIAAVVTAVVVVVAVAVTVGGVSLCFCEATEVCILTAHCTGVWMERAVSADVDVDNTSKLLLLMLLVVVIEEPL